MIELSNGFQLDKAAEVTEIGGNGDRAPNLVSCFLTFVLSCCWISLSLHPSTIRFTRSGDALVVRPLQITKTRKYESTIKSNTEAEDHGGGCPADAATPAFQFLFSAWHHRHRSQSHAGIVENGVTDCGGDGDERNDFEKLGTHLAYPVASQVTFVRSPTMVASTDRRAAGA
jgi:hypothetical protein